METKIKVTAAVLNMPEKEIKEHGWLVVRQSYTLMNPELWYYGFYKDFERAKTAAYEIHNGVVLEVNA